MEANRRRRVVHRRNPLSDITNTSPPVSSKPHRTNPSSSSTTSSSALDRRVTGNSTVAAATNLDNAPNPTSPSTPVPSTPSVKAPSLRADSITPPSIQIVDDEASDVEAYEPVQPNSVVYSLRSSSNKRKKDKGKAVADPDSSTPNLKISDIVDDEASNVEAHEPVQPISVVYSLRSSSNKRKKDKGKAVADPDSSTPNLKISDIVDGEASDVEAYEPVPPISVVYSSNKRKKDKGKAVAAPDSSTPNLKIPDRGEKNDEFEGLNLSKAKALTFPRAKKQRTLISEKDAIKNHQLQEYLEKQNAYFKEVDEFELEVESGNELD